MILWQLSMLKTAPCMRFSYPYEEFAGHVRAMQTVRKWEYTSRFGHLGDAQTSRANNARVVEYFADSYDDQSEAVCKAELLLSIYDYIGRHVDFFSRKNLLESLDGCLLSVDPALLRAVHYFFTAAACPASVDPKHVMTLAWAFKEIGPALFPERDRIS